MVMIEKTSSNKTAFQQGGGGEGGGDEGGKGGGEGVPYHVTYPMMHVIYL